MKLTNNYTLKTLRKILSDKYGIHVKTAIQNLDLDLLGDDEELDEAIFVAYIQLYLLEDRSNNIVGISKPAYSILNLVVKTIYEVIFMKLLIPSVGINYGLRYLLGYSLSNEMFRDEQSSKEALSLLQEFSIAFSTREFANHLDQFEVEAAKSGYKESSWHYFEFHKIESNPFILGCMSGYSGNSIEQIEIRRIVESIDTEDGE